MTKRKIFILFIILLIAIASYIYNRYQEQENEEEITEYVVTNVNIALGNPSNATNDPLNKENYLIEKPQYVLSYGNSNAGPNWVSWHLEASDIGDTPREENFHPEEALLEGFTRVLPSDYRGSNYDRGHLCNAKDRSKTREDIDATFSMANMLPQTPDLNRQVWENLESYCRNLTKKGDEMYIITGGYGSKEIIGNKNKINVPTNCWKVVLVLSEGDDDLKRINSKTRVIAVDMPNENGISKIPWRDYITTVRDIENKTGYNFFSVLSKEIQDAIETKKDSGSRKPEGLASLSRNLKLFHSEIVGWATHTFNYLSILPQ